jgi:hypothetical protein
MAIEVYSSELCNLPEYVFRANRVNFYSTAGSQAADEKQ